MHERAIRASCYGRPNLWIFSRTAVSKTCSGKIMRRILRKIRENLPGQLSDISTLADP